MIEKNKQKKQNTMGHRRYRAQYKTRIVLEILQGEKELGEIAAENNRKRTTMRTLTK